MFKKIICTAILMAALLAGTAMADEFPQPYAGDLVGTWAFAGGAEEHGEGFRLYADGTGVVLEAADYDQYPRRDLIETDSTFTWKVVYTGDKTLLWESYNDGYEGTCEVETWGDVRIHIPNGVSGGFYYPLLDEPLATYLAEKAAAGEMSAFDGVLEDYLDRSIGANLENIGIPMSELCLQQTGGVWRIVFTSYDRMKKQGYRFLLDEESVSILVDTWISLWADELGQSWLVPKSTKDYYAFLSDILEATLAEESVP